MAGFIPKEDLAAYQRWNANSFESKPKATKPAHPSAPKIAEHTEEEVITTIGLPTAADIERINESARNEGYEAGFAEGRQAGVENHTAAMASELAKLSGLISNLQAAIASMDQTIADQVLDLALEVAAQVIRGTIKVRNDVLLPVIREAISALPLHHGHLVLYLNPADALMIREQIGDQLQQTGTQIVDDDAVTQGGCSLKAGTSEIDATIETRWKRVLEAIGTEPIEWQSKL